MSTVLLVGGTGNLGQKVAQELHRAGYAVTALVRNPQKAERLKPFVQQFITGDATKPDDVSGLCAGIDIVVSTLGKSVSLNDRSRAGFEEVDYGANARLLQEARRQNVRKFVYVSALGAENYPDLRYFAVHHRFSQEIIASGLDYSIIKPPALFSAFTDLIDLAKKGMLVTPGDGRHLTNPIYEGDLARVIVESIGQPNSVVEAGGRQVYSRHQINELIQRHVNPNGKVRRIPLGLAKSGLPLMKLIDRNLYDKGAFFLEVLQHDVIAPQRGETSLETYLDQKLYARS
ncbi:SDR family oxidoreductase [Tellurirhabdus rosea]|uniref:SDR family oxidoreductase n=1 Tax=Tellurirhabdus rosea TaxID=2674997 RepID=UPI002255FEE5|nr:SDR family oxidoreductase [Tellurirhabdus rosea]